MEQDLLSDHEIIELVLKGKTERFGELVERYQKPVFRLALGMLSDRSDAEDASQEAFIRAFQSLSSYREAGRFWGWLRRITVNVSLRKIRPVTITSLEEVDLVPGLDGDTVYESVISSMESDDLRCMIYQLPAPYRSVIVLRYLEDMSYAEIADVLGESVTNVNVRIHRAKKMLREKMKVTAQ